jgi:hypothetical protein
MSLPSDPPPGRKGRHQWQSVVMAPTWRRWQTTMTMEMLPLPQTGRTAAAMIASTTWNNNQWTTRATKWWDGYDGIKQQSPMQEERDRAMKTTLEWGVPMLPLANNKQSKKQQWSRLQSGDDADRERTPQGWWTSMMTELNGDNAEETMVMKRHRQRRRCRDHKRDSKVEEGIAMGRGGTFMSCITIL